MPECYIPYSGSPPYHTTTVTAYPIVLKTENKHPKPLTRLPPLVTQLSGFWRTALRQYQNEEVSRKNTHCRQGGRGSIPPSLELVCVRGVIVAQATVALDGWLSTYIHTNDVKPNVYEIQTHKRFRKTLFIRTKHNMWIFRVIPFVKLQNDT